MVFKYRNASGIFGPIAIPLSISFSLELSHESSLAGGDLVFALLVGEFGGVPAFLGGWFLVLGLLVAGISTDAGMSLLVDLFQLSARKK